MLSNRQLFFAVHGRPAPRKAPRRLSVLHSSFPDRDAAYRAWIRTHPCCACGCEVDVQAAHTVNAGMRIKGSDYSCVPLCVFCHREFDSGLRSGSLFELDHDIVMAVLVVAFNQQYFGDHSE